MLRPLLHQTFVINYTESVAFLHIWFSCELTSCSSLLYAMRVLRNHGIPVASLHEVFRAIVLSKVMYCSPAWSGACSVADFSRLDVFLNRCKLLC